MIDGQRFWEGYSFVIARGVFFGTLGALMVQGLIRLAWSGVRALWAKYGHRIY